MSSVWTSWIEVLDSSRFFCLSVRICFTPWTYCPQGVLARVAFDEKAFLEPCRGKITHRHSILSLALRKNDVLILSTSFFSAIGKSTSCRSPCMDFLPPSGGVFRLSHLGVIAGYPMQTVMRFSRCGAGFGNKKSPHNNLNLTIPSGMALVRVCYVAIRKLKTCSGSFGSRAGTLSKYVILNCWDRLPQKSSRVNVNLSGRSPSILLCKTVLSLKSPTGAFIAPLRFANANF